MFIAALFTIAKAWNQPKCPLMDELIKMWYIYTMEYYSAIKKHVIGTFLVVQWLGLHASNARGIGSIPGQGTKIPHAIWHDQNNEK